MKEIIALFLFGFGVIFVPLFIGNALVFYVSYFFMLDTNFIPWMNYLFGWVFIVVCGLFYIISTF